MTNIYNDIPYPTLASAAALADQATSLPKIRVNVLVDVSNFTYDETLFQKLSFQDNIMMNLRQKIGLGKSDDDGGTLGSALVAPESNLFLTLDAADRILDYVRSKVRSLVLINVSYEDRMTASG